MTSDREFDTLQNKYNVAIAKAQDLQEQLLTKQKQWEKRDEDFEVVEKVTRELCEDILAKDPKEMVLGADYSWSSIPILELISKAKRVFREYNESRKDIMSKIMDQSELRRQEIESLQEQIVLMKTHPGAMDISQEELKQQIDKEKEKQKALKNLPPKIQQSMTDGEGNILMDDHDDFDDIENDLYNGIAEKDAKVQITPKSIPVTQNRKQLNKKKVRKQQKMMAHTINLKEYEEKLDDVSFKILEVIGSKGVSIYSDIEAYVLKDIPTTTQSKCRISMGILTSMSLTNKEPIQNPLKGKLYVYQLTDMGSRVYHDKYGQVPVSSEMDIIIAEHDNCVHGFGIKFIADLLRETGEYEDVSDMNRKNPIQIGSGISYIPDIICTDKNGMKTYIEYERVTHTQTNFNAKCNKMSKVTDTLNFIVPNQNDVIRIKSKIESWIKSRGQKALEHITVRVTGAFQLKGTDLSDNKNWKVVYRPGKRLEPYENF